MGCYGIGVERAMAACIEVHHDEKGIVWPAAVAPFEAVVIVAQQNDAAVAEAGERAYRALLDAGVDVIIDDRPDRAGVKFSDAELVGIPFRVTIGKRGLAAGIAELTSRATGETVAVPARRARQARPAKRSRAPGNAFFRAPRRPLGKAPLGLGRSAARSRAWLRSARATSSRPSASRRRSAAGGSGEASRKASVAATVDSSTAPIV